MPKERRLCDCGSPAYVRNDLHYYRYCRCDNYACLKTTIGEFIFGTSKRAEQTAFKKAIDNWENRKFCTMEEINLHRQEALDVEQRRIDDINRKMGYVRVAE